MIGFCQIESQFNNKFLSNMILFRFLIVSALLFACANAELDRLIEALINVVKDNVNFFAALGTSAIALPSKVLLSVLGSNPTTSKSVSTSKSVGVRQSLEDQIQLLQSVLGGAHNQMRTQDVQH